MKKETNQGKEAREEEEEGERRVSDGSMVTPYQEGPIRLEKTVAQMDICATYRARSNGMQILLSRTQAGLGRAGRKEQEQTPLNHMPTII